jgi:hypothetical protein
MLTKCDIAIKENILKPGTVESFFKNVYIRKPDDAIVADSIEDFMRQITDPCHIWQGQIIKGYGRFNIYSKSLKETAKVRAHRFAYALAYGFDALPQGICGGDGNQLILNHLCHNRACVNPKHLEIITDNHNRTPEKKRKKANV